MSPKIDALAGAAAIDAATATMAAELATDAARSAKAAPQRAAANAEAARAERIRRELSSEEGSWLGRLMPKRNPWPELQELDEKIAALDAAQAAAGADAQRLEAELRDAEEQDRAVLAGWHVDGAEGKRPEATVPALREQLEQRQEDRDAFAEASTAAVAGKVEFFSKNRKALARRVAGLRAKSHTRMLELIDELERERDDLLELRDTELFALLYPAAEAATDVPRSLVLGLAQPMRETIGQSTQLSADRVWALLRADADLIQSAINTEQKTALQGADPHDPRSAVWAETDAGRERDRAEKREALERHKREWGDYPA